jgi:hypothetical protein
LQAKYLQEIRVSKQLRRLNWSKQILTFAMGTMKDESDFKIDIVFNRWGTDYLQ